jgi:hypothetical protein
MLATYVQAYKILEDYYENVCKSNIEMGKTQKNDEIQKMKLIEKVQKYLQVASAINIGLRFFFCRSSFHQTLNI